MGRLRKDLLQPSRNLLVSFSEELDKLAGDVFIATVEEGNRDTSVTRTTSTTDAVDVVINIRGQVIVDDVGDVRDIQASRGDGSSNHNRRASAAEGGKRVLAFTLGSITVNRSGGELATHQELGEHIGHALGFDKDECQTVLALCIKNVKQDGAFVLVFDIFNLLGDILGGRPDAPNREEDVLLQEVLGEDLDVAREGGAEHESLTIMDARHIFSLDDTADLGFKTHVEHAVSLVQNKILDVRKRDAAALDQVNKAPRCSAQQVTATLDLAQLLVDVSATIDDSTPDPRTVGEFAGLVMNLADEFAGGGENEGRGVGLARVRLGGTCRRRARTIGE